MPRKGKRHRRNTDAWSPSTVLWFGKYKGQPISDAPRGYLAWLTEQPAHSSWRINALCGYLRVFLTGTGTATRKPAAASNSGPGLAAHDRETESSRPSVDGVPKTEPSGNPLELAFQQLAKEPG